MSVKWTIAKKDDMGLGEEFMTVAEGVEIKHMTPVQLGHDQVFYFIDPEQVKEFEFKEYQIKHTGRKVIHVYRDMKLIAYLNKLEVYTEQTNGVYLLNFYGHGRNPISLDTGSLDRATVRAEAYIKSHYPKEATQ